MRRVYDDPCKILDGDADLAIVSFHTALAVGERKPRGLRQVQAFPRHVRTSRETSNLRPRRSTVNFLKEERVRVPIPFATSSFVMCGEIPNAPVARSKPLKYPSNTSPFDFTAST